MLAVRGLAGRLTHIRGYGHQDQKDQDEAYQKTKEFPPPLFPHAHHPLYQGVANRLCMYSAPFAGTDPVAPCGVGCIIGGVSYFVNSLPILMERRVFPRALRPSLRPEVYFPEKHTMYSISLSPVLQ